MKKHQVKKCRKRNISRRFGIGLLIAAVTFSMTGCGKVIDLTDEENHLIAEYAAELLLKYDKGYHMRYDPDDVTEETMTQTDADTTSAATESATTEATTTEAEKKPEDTKSDTTQAAVTSEEPVDGAINATVDPDFDIASFVGENRISARYSYYMLADSYPSYDQDGMYIEVQAPEGYKLLVLKFDIENKTDEDQNIDLYSKDVTYNIIIDNNRKSKQMLTILSDDLYTFSKTVMASSREEDVLLYTVSDSVAQQMKDVKLQVKYGGTSAVLQLEQ